MYLWSIDIVKYRVDHKNVAKFGAERGMWNTEAEMCQTKHRPTCIFLVSKQSHVGYTEIQVAISYFNQDTKQNSATCQNEETPTKFLVKY